MRVVLLSTYELGHQPFGLASPAAWLRAAGADVVEQDLSRDRLDEDAVRSAAVVAFYLPMHTATRLALPVIDRVRSLNPSARIVAYGLYALTNAGLLRARGVEGLFGGEFEAALVAFALHPSEVSPEDPRVDIETGLRVLGGPVARLTFITPDRAGLPPLSRYARLQHGARRLVSGYTEASRGCKHLCRHCPVVPVYGGQFRIVPVDVVLGDIRNQVAAGAEHVTFGDPDFFNGPAHAVRVVEALHAEFPGLTYDVTIKVEHLLRHARHLPLLKRTGCLFVTSAVESVDDTVLARLDKGHTS
ncbi:MAG: radical SAM protein, partial [Acidobacteriota bacterium]